MYLSYTPTRKLMGGDGEISHNLAKFLYVPKENSKASKSMSGQTETVMYSIDDIHDIKTQPIARSAMSEWREWYASTAAGETFVLDADDAATKAVPVNAMNVLRLPNTYKETQEGIYFIIAFKVQQVY